MSKIKSKSYTETRLLSSDLNISDLDYSFKREVINFLPKRKFINVLDYGAGNSPWEAHIDCENYVKADISQNASNDIDYILEINTPIEISDEKFELILMMDVFEHTPNPDFTLKECYRLCKKGGEIVLSVPFIYRENETPCDYFRLTSFGAEELLSRHGFKIKKIKKIGNIFLTLYSLLYERNIKNGELVRVTAIGRSFNRVLRIFLPILNKTLFIKNPDNDDGIYHHTLIQAEKY